MDAEVPYTTLEPKWQLVRGHVRIGGLAGHAIVPTANPPFHGRLKPLPNETLVGEPCPCLPDHWSQQPRANHGARAG
jgi:hypothetical protein